MKVVGCIFNLSKGGAQGVFVNVMNYLHEHHIDIEVVTQNLEDPVYLDVLNPNIKVSDLRAGGSAKALYPALLNYVKNNSFTHIFAFSPEIAVILYIIKKQLRRDFKIIGRCINTLSKEYEFAKGVFRKFVTPTLLKLLYHRVDAAIAQSKGMKEDLVAHWGFKNDQVTVINNALRPEFENQIKQKEWIAKDNYILYAGRLEQQKGLPILLEAFAKITDKDVRLKLVGSGSQKADLEELAKKLNISERIDFLDHTNRIIDYYSKARATVMTSYFEGFPNVLSESIACGTPVVSFDLPSGPEEIIVGGINGYLVPYLDIDSFVTALDSTLAKRWNPNEIKETAGRYTRDRILSQYVTVLKDVNNV